MLTDIWFWLFLGAAGSLALALAHNITSGAKLRAEIIAEFNALKDKFDKPSPPTTPYPGSDAQKAYSLGPKS